jgi:hypothetical protein
MGWLGLLGHLSDPNEPEPNIDRHSVGGLGIPSPSPLGVLGAAWPQPPGTSSPPAAHGSTLLDLTQTRASQMGAAAASERD